MWLHHCSSKTGTRGMGHIMVAVRYTQKKMGVQVDGKGLE